MLALVYRVVMPVSTPMLGRWLTGEPVTRDAVPLERISPALVRAVFTAEDQKFCMHHGVDWGSLTDVIEDQSRAALTKGPGGGLVDDVRINWVWMPPWGPDKITDDGREQLRALGFTV